MGSFPVQGSRPEHRSRRDRSHRTLWVLTGPFWGCVWGSRRQSGQRNTGVWSPLPLRSRGVLTTTSTVRGWGIEWDPGASRTRVSLRVSTRTGWTGSFPPTHTTHLHHSTRPPLPGIVYGDPWRGPSRESWTTVWSEVRRRSTRAPGSTRRCTSTPRAHPVRTVGPGSYFDVHVLGVGRTLHPRVSGGSRVSSLRGAVRADLVSRSPGRSTTTGRETRSSGRQCTVPVRSGKNLSDTRCL